MGMSSPFSPGSSSDSSAEIVWEFVRGIPKGYVVTYGQIAEMVVDVRVTARQVGGIMQTCPPDVPWQRVIGAGGFLPIAKRSPELARDQRVLLENEGISFLSSARIDLAKHRWLGSLVELDE